MNIGSELANRRITRRMKKYLKKKNHKLKHEALSEEKCSICLIQILPEKVTILPCGHAFCIQCTVEWWEYNSTCPFCRKQFRYILNSKKECMNKEEVAKRFKNLIHHQEKTLRCEVCWADIGDEVMRICHDCRGIYVHMRCLNEQQKKIRIFLCYQCGDLRVKESESEQEQEEKEYVFKGKKFFDEQLLNSSKTYLTRHNESSYHELPLPFNRPGKY